MTGTEKQIAFAENLMEKMNVQFDTLITECEKMHPELVEQWSNIKDGYNRIMSNAYAGFVIDLLKSNNESNYQEYYKTLFVAVKYGTDEMCKRIKEEVYGK